MLFKWFFRTKVVPNFLLISYTSVSIVKDNLADVISSVNYRSNRYWQFKVIF